MLRQKLQQANQELHDAKHGPCCDELVKTQEKLKDTMSEHEDYKEKQALQFKVYDKSLDGLNRIIERNQNKCKKHIAYIKSQYESQIDEYKKMFGIQSTLQKEELQKISRKKSSSGIKKSQSRTRISGGKRRTKRRQRKSCRR